MRKLEVRRRPLPASGDIAAGLVLAVATHRTGRCQVRSDERAATNRCRPSPSPAMRALAGAMLLTGAHADVTVALGT